MSPFKSKDQAKWMFANKPKMAKEWASMINDMSKLPKKKIHRSTAKSAAKKSGF